MSDAVVAAPAGLTLPFDNRFVRELPADPEPENFRRQVNGAFYSRVRPTPVKRPHTLAYSREVAALLGISESYCESAEFAEVFAGNRLLPGMQPYASVYGGHQFGHWAGQLGDGRAINLGEIVNAAGERWALQLKGAGPTPYSRTADGLAVLRSSLREFLCSEAMHHLGVPTTRALSLVGTGEQVLRDMLYDGNPRHEPGAVVCRVAPSFTRFGHFQLPAARGEIGLLRQLVDYTVRVDFPHLVEAYPAGTAERDRVWFREICERTADMIVHWLRVGFVHGVMNTDNMSVLGLTIDYGPYGWLEDFDPDWTPNTTDAGGRRYRYAHQPQIALWNLSQFANALLPLFGDAEPLQTALDVYGERFHQGWQATLAAKLGLRDFDAARGDEELTQELLGLLAAVETDMTIFFRRLAEVDLDALGQDASASEALAPLREAYYREEQLDADYRARALNWLRRYAGRVAADGLPAAERRRIMHAVNPKYVLRNYIAQLAIDRAEAGDGSLIRELLELLRRPYDEQPGQQRWAEKRPEWARHRVGCSMLSCSS